MESIIHQAEIQNIQQIASHTWHLKIHCENFNYINYIPGYTIEFFLGNPYEEPTIEHRKYSIWNYEPITNKIDIAICTFSNGKAVHWLRTLQVNDIIYFKSPVGKLLLDDTGDYYCMIGDITALSHLYEINRNLPVSKKVFSFIYADQFKDVFPDIDGSFPFDYHVLDSISIDEIKEKLIALMPKSIANGIAYILGNPAVCIEIHNYFKGELAWSSAQLKTKPFWK